MRTHVSLFSGIGGFDLAAEALGYKTILFVEKDLFCQKVLRKNFPSVPIVEDIHDVTKETLAESQRTRPSRTGRGDESEGTECRTFNKDTEGHSTRERAPDFAVDLLTAGVPCQPASVAGKQRGKEDDRWLWGEALRVVQELRPRWVVFENPTGIVSMVEYDSRLVLDDETYTEADIRDMGATAYQAIERTGRGILDEIVVSLEGQGYEVWLDVHPACAVDAPHRRNRIFIVAHATQPDDGGGDAREDTGQESQSRSGGGESNVADAEAGAERAGLRQSGETGGRGRRPGDGSSQDNVANASGIGRGEGRTESAGRQREPASAGGSDVPDADALRCERRANDEGEGQTERDGHPGASWWTVEPDVGRVAHGVPHRVDRLRALGNAVVPQQVYPILKAIADIETKRMTE